MLLLTLLLPLELLMLAFLLALQKLLFAPRALFDVERIAIRRQNRRDACGLRLNGDGDSRRHRHSRCNRWRRRLDPGRALAWAAHHGLRCQGGGRQRRGRQARSFAQIWPLQTLR